MTDETVTSGHRWECPHCGTMNFVEPEGWNDNEFGYEECTECESFVRLEASIQIEFCAHALRVKDIPRVKAEYSIKADNAEDLLRLAESLDDDFFEDEAHALKLATETPVDC